MLYEVITVVNTCCPFGDGVTNFPELCRMTSSVFGGIAARNFGYAKVVLDRTIARGNRTCLVSVYLNEQVGRQGEQPEESGHDFSAHVIARWVVV